MTFKLCMASFGLKLKMAQVTYNWLGKTGLRVSNISLGTMTFGEHPQGRPGCSEAEAHTILDRYAELGGNFIDTADLYQHGKAEVIVGNWLKKQKREKFVIITKCGKAVFDPTDPNSYGASRKNILFCLDESLKRLQTDYVDIFMIHTIDYGTPFEETLSALNDAVKQGKIRYVATSNMKGWMLQKMVEICKQKQFEPIVCLQQQYNLLCRSSEWEVAEVCHNEGIAFLPWSPLKGGWLSGKMKRGMTKAPDGSRVDWASGRAHDSHPDFAWFADNEQVWRVLDTMEEIAKQQNKTMAQVALRWLLQKQVVPSVVVGVSSIRQLEDNMGAASGWELSKDQMLQLDQVSTILAPYPYHYIMKDNVNRIRESTYTP